MMINNDITKVVCYSRDQDICDLLQNAEYKIFKDVEIVDEIFNPDAHDIDSLGALTVIDVDGDRGFLDQLIGGDLSRKENILLIGTIDEIATYRTILKRRFKDYLVKPIEISDISRILYGAGYNSEDNTTGTLVSVIGSSGGIGTTSLCCLLSTYYSKKQNKKTVLFDSDLVNGDCSYRFNTTKTSGLTSVINHPDRIDSLYVANIRISVNKNLSIVSEEANIASPMTYDSKGFLRIADLIREDSDVLVADIPYGLFTPTYDMIVSSEKILINATSTLKSFAYTKKMLEALKKRISLDRVAIVTDSSSDIISEIKSFFEVKNLFIFDSQREGIKSKNFSAIIKFIEV